MVSHISSAFIDRLTVAIYRGLKSFQTIPIKLFITQVTGKHLFYCLLTVLYGMHCKLGRYAVADYVRGKLMVIYRLFSNYTDLLNA